MRSSNFQFKRKRSIGGWVGEQLGLRTLLCAGPGCRRFTVTHRWLRRDGIFLSDRWLCSPLCFEGALAAMLETAGPGRRFAMPRMPRMPFRLILLQRELLSEPELQLALEYSEDTGKPIGNVLVELGFATIEQVASARAAENGCAFYALPPAALPPELRLPLSLSEACRAVAIHATSDRIMLGFTERVDRGLAQMMEHVTGLRVECCFITQKHFEKQLALEAAGPAVALSATPAESKSVSRVAAAVYLGEQALVTGAETVRVGRSGQRLWVRMTGENGRALDTHLELTEESFTSQIPLSGQMRSRSDKKMQVL